MNQNYFITGTDTGVGKTHVTALLLAELRRRGLPAAGFKPIACGADGRADARTFRKLMRNEVPLDVLNPVYLRHPLAPSVAAQIEGRRIDPQKIQSIFRLLATVFAPVLVEGAGGLLVPILARCHPECVIGEHFCSREPARGSGGTGGAQQSREQARGYKVPYGDKAKKQRPYFVADLARQLDLPVIIVARLGLGTLNHTLLTVRQAQAMQLKVAGVILNDTTGRRGQAERTNVRVIPELTGVPLLGVMPHGNGTAAAQAICRRLFSL